MHVTDRGHLYKLQNNKSKEHEVSLKFYKDAKRK